MKTNKKLLAGILAIGISSLVGGTYASAHMTTNTQVKRNDTTRIAIDQALTNADYTAFKTAISGKEKPADAPVITEAIFAKMVEAHKLRLAGDTAGTEKIMSELGFKKPQGHGGPQIDESKLTDIQKAALKEARALMDSGKYDEARAVLEKANIPKPEGRGFGKRMLPNLTAAQQKAFTEAKTLFDAGKPDEAKKILDNAGIKPPQKNTQTTTQ